VFCPRLHWCELTRFTQKRSDKNKTVIGALTPRSFTLLHLFEQEAGLSSGCPSYVSLPIIRLSLSKKKCQRQVLTWPYWPVVRIAIQSVICWSYFMYRGFADIPPSGLCCLTPIKNSISIPSDRPSIYLLFLAKFLITHLRPTSSFWTFAVLRVKTFSRLFSFNCILSKGPFIATRLNSTQLNSTRQREQQLTQFVDRDVINKNTTDLAVRCSTGSVEFSWGEVSCVAINTP